MIKTLEALVELRGGGDFLPRDEKKNENYILPNFHKWMQRKAELVNYFEIYSKLGKDVWDISFW